MELKTCKRCGEVWFFHGSGRPLRCGKCKSPYWDRERRDEAVVVKAKELNHVNPIRLTCGPLGTKRGGPGCLPGSMLSKSSGGSMETATTGTRRAGSITASETKQSTGLCPHGSEAKFCRIGTCAAGRER